MAPRALTRLETRWSSLALGREGSRRGWERPRETFPREQGEWEAGPPGRGRLRWPAGARAGRPEPGHLLPGARPSPSSAPRPPPAPASPVPLPPASARLSPRSGFQRAEYSSAEPRGPQRAGLRPGQGDAGGRGGDAGTDPWPKRSSAGTAPRLSAAGRRTLARPGKSSWAARAPWGQPGGESNGRSPRECASAQRGAAPPTGDPAKPLTSSKVAELQLELCPHPYQDPLQSGAFLRESWTHGAVCQRDKQSSPDFLLLSPLLSSAQKK
ncbi:PREDICTED: translation initiation factor IF-2-like [Chinchilla lanigera]|uniref:translation initiation factor IF-2-like n=1 Tax=Chinchilla lanigera TaxID=34839 RepID=UPI000696CCF2|nr:PREDICTED: translation initiation factor IF-2-like [Chinchilla lanigera]